MIALTACVDTCVCAGMHSKGAFFVTYQRTICMLIHVNADVTLVLEVI